MSASWAFSDQSNIQTRDSASWDLQGLKTPQNGSWHLASPIADLAQHAFQRIQEQGGVTLGLNGEEPSQGYAYSPYPELEKVVPLEHLSPQLVGQYLQDTQQALSQPGNYFGAWVSDGNAFLDISHIGPVHQDTINEAAKAKQLAVYDLERGQEIPTGVEREVEHTSTWKLSSPEEEEQRRPQTKLPIPFPNRRKFTTTDEDHERGKLKWGLPIPHVFKRSAVDPDWLNEWINKNGPYMMHQTQSPWHRDKIMNEGLIPHDQGPGSIYSRDLVPRANHSYIQTPRHKMGDRLGDDTQIYVDLRRLDPQRINADEDAFSRTSEQQRWGLPITGDHRPGPDEGYSDFHLQDENGQFYRHWGEWADHHKLNGPDHTAHSLNSNHTLAIHGGIDPNALVLPEVGKADLEKNYSHVFRASGGRSNTVTVPHPLDSVDWDLPAKSKDRKLGVILKDGSMAEFEEEIPSLKYLFDNYDFEPDEVKEFYLTSPHDNSLMAASKWNDLFEQYKHEHEKAASRVAHKDKVDSGWDLPNIHARQKGTEVAQTSGWRLAARHVHVNDFGQYGSDDAEYGMPLLWRPEGNDIIVDLGAENSTHGHLSDQGAMGYNPGYIHNDVVNFLPSEEDQFKEVPHIYHGQITRALENHLSRPLTIGTPWRQTRTATSPEFLEAPGGRFSPPDAFHGIGPVHPEEFALNTPPMRSQPHACPKCGLVSRWPLGVCPHCGNPDDPFHVTGKTAVNLRYKIPTDDLRTAAVTLRDWNDGMGWGDIEHDETPFLIQRGASGHALHLGTPGGIHEDIYDSMLNEGHLPEDWEDQDHIWKSFERGWIQPDRQRINYVTQSPSIYHGQATQLINNHLGTQYAPNYYGHGRDVMRYSSLWRLAGVSLRDWTRETEPPGQAARETWGDAGVKLSDAQIPFFIEFNPSGRHTVHMGAPGSWHHHISEVAPITNAAERGWVNPSEDTINFVTNYPSIYHGQTKSMFEKITGQPLVPKFHGDAPSYPDRPQHV
jgi:hypothetical protein